MWRLLRCSTGFCGLQFLTTSLLSKAGKCFTRKGTCKSKPHSLSGRQQSAVSGSRATCRKFICQLGPYAYQGRYRCSYDISFFQTADTHALPDTHNVAFPIKLLWWQELHWKLTSSFSNACPSSHKHIIRSQEKAICKVNYFLTLNAPGILGNRGCNMSIPQFTRRLPPLPLYVRIKGELCDM